MFHAHRLLVECSLFLLDKLRIMRNKGPIPPCFSATIQQASLDLDHDLTKRPVRHAIPHVLGHVYELRSALA